jgi:hypothetical protein
MVAIRFSILITKISLFILASRKPLPLLGGYAWCHSARMGGFDWRSCQSTPLEINFLLIKYCANGKFNRD